MTLTTVLSFCLCVAVATSAADSVIKRDVAQSQLQCVQLLTSHLTDNDATCGNVATAITPLLANPDILALDGLTGSVFAEFCRPSCGRHILTAWETCNVTQNYQRQVNLVTSVCAHTRGMDCYENLAELFEFIEFVETCPSDVEGQCSEECRNRIDDSNDAFGCCVNIPIDFRTAGGETDLVSVVDSVFDNCNERRRDACDAVIIEEPGFISGLVDINQALTSENIVCIDAAIQSRNIAAECKAAASTLSVIINSNSLITSLSADNSVLSEFCKSSCGPQITNTWMSCGAYDAIKAEAEFLTGLCGIHQGQPCYVLYDALQVAIDDTTYCGTRTNGITCPTACLSVYENLLEGFGCCVNIYIDYLDGVIKRKEGDPTIRERNIEIFGLCNSEIPPACSESALESSSSMSDPTACPSSADKPLPTYAVLLVAAVYIMDRF